MIVLIAVLILLFLVIWWYISTGNRFHTLNATLNEWEDELDRTLAHCSDLLSQLLELCHRCPACAAYDLPVLCPFHPGSSMDTRNQTATQISALIRHIHTLAKAHPTLLVNGQYRALQLALRDSQEQLERTRRSYNNAASRYNRLLTHFFSRSVGRHLHLKPRELFQPSQKR